EPKRAPQVEVGAELGSDEGVHEAGERPTRQEVHPLPPKLPCARTRENELEFPGLDEPMNLVQELGDALHLVHDDPAGETRRDQIAEARWGGEELRVNSRVEKIEEQPVRQVQVKPRSF